MPIGSAFGGSALRYEIGDWELGNAGRPFMPVSPSAVIGDRIYRIHTIGVSSLFIQLIASGLHAELAFHVEGRAGRKRRNEGDKGTEGRGDEGRETSKR